MSVLQQTILVSGNDTGVGKSWVVRMLAEMFAERGASVQVVKPVETGAPELPDAKTAIAGLSGNVSAHTLFSFPEAMAPLCAAKRAGEVLSFEDICAALADLPETEVRLIEGAGGLAVPLDQDGRDWADLARVLQVDYVVLVLEDRLGAINQARLLAHYTKSLPAGMWLNECYPQNEAIHTSNCMALEQLSIPLWAIQRVGKRRPEWEILPFVFKQ